MDNINGSSGNFCKSTAIFFLLIMCPAIGFAMDKKVTVNLPITANNKSVNIENVKNLCKAIYLKAIADNFTPDHLIGLSPEGLVPLGFLAAKGMFNNNALSFLLTLHTEDLKNYTSILVVDAAVTSGKKIQSTVEALRKELPGTVIKSATLFYKKQSELKPDYYAQETENWIIFPWDD